MSAADNNSEKV